MNILKLLKEDLSGPFVHVINLIFEKGIFPTDLKRGLIIPVYKKSSRSSVDNYRPVTLLNAVSKIVERVIYGRLVDFFDKGSVISSCQHGFRADRSTESAACEFMSQVYGKLDDGQYVAGIFFDLSRAFDCLNIDFVLDKLYVVGIRGHALALMRSYLTERKCCVRVDGNMSQYFEVDTGVPQGSVLGPLIFLIYVNDLYENVIDGQVAITSFADDTSMVVSARTPEGLRENISKVVQDFDSWCFKNSLILNIDKTSYVHFRAKVNRVAVVSQLKPSPVTKFLGIHLDEHLCWEAHVDHVSSRVSSGIFAISQLKRTHGERALLNVYFSLIYGHLSYIVSLWGNCSQSNRVFIAQKRALRLMFGIQPRESCRAVFVEKKLLTFPCIYMYRTILYIKKRLDTFDTNSTYHCYDTRGADLLLMERHHLTLYEKSPGYLGKKLYNALPDQLQSLNYSRFKSRLKNYLISKCYYSVAEFLSDPHTNYLV